MSQYTPLRSSSYIDLPEKIKNKKICNNVKNNDNKCFMWSILSALHPIDKKHPDRVKNINNMKIIWNSMILIFL